MTVYNFYTHLYYMMAENKGSLQTGLMTDQPTLYATGSSDDGYYSTGGSASSPEALVVEARGETVLREGTFHEGFVSYSLVGFILISCLSFMFPLLLFIPCAMIGFKAQFGSFRVILSDKTVTFTQGKYACFCCCWGSSERIVPLEKITDATWLQGCLQRNFGIDELNIRTAAGSMGGEAAGAGSTADIHLVGLNEAKEFRTALLKAKDERDHFLATGVRVMDGGGGSAAAGGQAPMAQSMSAAPMASAPETTAALTSIDATLVAIKELLFEKAEEQWPDGKGRDDAIDVEA